MVVWGGWREEDSEGERTYGVLVMGHKGVTSMSWAEYEVVAEILG